MIMSQIGWEKELNRKNVNDNQELNKDILQHAQRSHNPTNEKEGRATLNRKKQKSGL